MPATVTDGLANYLADCVAHCRSNDCQSDCEPNLCPDDIANRMPYLGTLIKQERDLELLSKKRWGGLR